MILESPQNLPANLDEQAPKSSVDITKQIPDHGLTIKTYTSPRVGHSPFLKFNIPLAYLGQTARRLSARRVFYFRLDENLVPKARPEAMQAHLSPKFVLFVFYNATGKPIIN